MSLHNSFQIILPVFNEKARIAITLSHLWTYCSRITVIDNKSTDDTIEIVNVHFPETKIVTILNSGTTETGKWWLDAVSHFETDYILFASCSELIPGRLLDVFAGIARSGSVDIVDVPRTSITGNQSTNYLYFKPSSIFSKNIQLPLTSRFLRWKAIDPAKIAPHDSFRSQDQCVRFVLDTKDPDLILHHYRLMPSKATFRKHLLYAKEYSKHKCKSNFFYALKDSFLRILLDSSRIIRSIVDKKFNRVLAIEYSLRIAMHLQVVFFSLLPKLR
jgi:glycosyltransferase involved in cell wall biosynthesis